MTKPLEKTPVQALVNQYERALTSGDPEQIALFRISLATEFPLLTPEQQNRLLTEIKARLANPPQKPDNE